jgi:acetyltransferase-like isoleucine patch superfamily enzyme
VGVLDEEFAAGLRADPAAFGALSSEERCDAYRRHGAVIGEDVVLGAGTAIVAPRIVLADGVTIGAHSIVRCEEVFAAGEIAWTGESLKLTCRRAFIGAGTWIAANVQVGGGGHRDPWATFVMGELGFMGGEAFVNVCRPVVIGREAFLTMRSVLLTHNIGHSVLEGFENRFAGVVLEDRAQIGVGAVVYAGCRIGREAIVVSNSYVVSDVHEGALVGGVPARTIGKASRAPARARQVELAKRIVDELEEVLRLSGVATAPLGDGARGFELTGAEGPGRVVFVETVGKGTAVPGGDGDTVVLALEATGGPPPGCAVLDLLGRRVHGDGGVLLDSVREFCRKRGIRFEPGPWRYGRGLI